MLAFVCVFYSLAERLELDEQHLFRIPALLIAHAGLNNEIVLIRVQYYLEILDKLRWERYLAEQAKEFDRIAEEAFGPQQPPGNG